MFSNGDYHASFSPDNKGIHYGYVNKKFNIDGGTKLRKLFQTFEKSVLCNEIPMSKSLCTNLKEKWQRESRKENPIEEYFKQKQRKTHYSPNSRKIKRKAVSPNQTKYKKRRKISETEE